jgi:hypothetical protein
MTGVEVRQRRNVTCPPKTESDEMELSCTSSALSLQSAGGNGRMFRNLDGRGGLALAYSLYVDSKEMIIHHWHFEYRAAGPRQYYPWNAR